MNKFTKTTKTIAIKNPASTTDNNSNVAQPKENKNLRAGLILHKTENEPELSNQCYFDGDVIVRDLFFVRTTSAANAERSSAT